MPAASFKIRVAPSLALVDAKAWDACANPAGLSEPEAAGERYNPFISTHSCSRWSDRNRSARAPAGRPRMCSSRTADGRLVAAAPAYLKTHSLGEYVFDHSWAQAYEQMGGRYYPKLQVAVPFTPVTGRRLLVAADAPPGAREALIAALRGAARGGRRLLGARHLRHAARGRRRAARRRLRARAPASNSTSSTKAMATSRISSPRFPRASARRSGASGGTRWATTSTIDLLTGSGHQNKRTGTRSSPSTWTPARANGAAPI